MSLAVPPLEIVVRRHTVPLFSIAAMPAVHIPICTLYIVYVRSTVINVLRLTFYVCAPSCEKAFPL